MGIGVTITRDYEAIAWLNQFVHNMHVKLYPDYFKEYDYEGSKAFFKEMVNRPDILFLLAEEERENIGYAMLEKKEYPDTIFKKPYRSLYIHQISVSDRYKNKGYGTKLLEKACYLAKEEGIDKVELDYWLGNKEAEEFYFRKQFKPYRQVVMRELS
ncbi:MAG: GNAT family N-acetyltransferase [Bacillus sp. (in: firmicutes)]